MSSLKLTLIALSLFSPLMAEAGLLAPAAGGAPTQASIALPPAGGVILGAPQYTMPMGVQPMGTGSIFTGLYPNAQVANTPWSMYTGGLNTLSPMNQTPFMNAAYSPAQPYPVGNPFLQPQQMNQTNLANPFLNTTGSNPFLNPQPTASTTPSSSESWDSLVKKFFGDDKKKDKDIIDEVDKDLDKDDIKPKARHSTRSKSEDLDEMVTVNPEPETPPTTTPTPPPKAAPVPAAPAVKVTPAAPAPAPKPAPPPESFKPTFVPPPPKPTVSTTPEKKPFTKSEAEAVMGKIDRVNQAVKTPTDTPNTPPPECPECQAAAANLHYEQCSAKNNYLEEILARPNNKALQITKDYKANPLTLKCISESMQAVDTTKATFASCPQSGGGYGAKVERPCASENMVKTVAASFELVTNCFAGYIDADADTTLAPRQRIERVMFQLLNYESGWTVNSVDSVSAGGLGHLYSPLIASINKTDANGASEWSRMKDYMKKSTSAACKSLEKADLQPLSAEAPNVKGCDRMALDKGNPMLNLMYTMAHLKSVRNAVVGTLKGTDVSPALQRVLVDQLTVWGYSSGERGISEILKSSLAKEGSLLKGQAGKEELRKFMDTMVSEASTWHAKNTPNAPGDKPKYLVNSLNQLRNVQTRANSKNCGAF